MKARPQKGPTKKPARDRDLTGREMAFCGLFGAAALLLPVIFHLVHLGHVFMPMYLPLMALPFFVRPLPAAATALIVPLLSGAATGMPPFFPPIAVFMALELSVMAALVSAVRQRWPSLHELAVLVPVLLFGRVFYVALVYFFSVFIQLPAKFMAGLSLVSGWPGVVLMVVVIPAVARASRSPTRPSTKRTQELSKEPPPQTAKETTHELRG